MGLSGGKRIFNETFSRFDTKHACDTQTDGIAIAYTRASTASRG